MTRQGDLFHVKPSGAELRDEALADFERRQPDWLFRARAMLVELATREGRAVCSDDVWRFCPPPAGVHPSVMGSVFKSGLFVQAGWRASSRPSAHARVIRFYTLR